MRIPMQHQNTKLDFIGQHIYVALDTHKKSWQTTILTEETEHKTFSQPPQVSVLVNYLHRMFPGATYHCVYEAGFSGFWIHDALKQQGVDCVVVNPADVPTKHKEHEHKTDRVDSRKLARNLRNGELDALYVPVRSALEDRSLVRLRTKFVGKQTRCKNQIKALLDFYGIVLPEQQVTTHWSNRFLTWLNEIRMQRATGDQTLALLLEELHFFRTSIATLTKKIRLLALEEPYCKFVPYLVTIPGISTLSAMILLTELVEMQRFHSLDALKSYCGLIPGEHSSGEREIVTGLSHRRNPYLRTLLIECSWVAVRKDPALLQTFATLSRRMHKNQAIVRIASKLVARIRFVLLHQQPYQLCHVASVG